MLLRSLLLLFFFGVTVSTGHVRLKRFLNAEVHNRIDVLSKSHEDHQAQTSLLRNIIFGSTITLSVLFLLSIIGLVTLCVLFRRHRRRNRSSSFPTHLTSSLPGTVDPTTLHNLFRMMSDTRPTPVPPSIPMLRF